MQKNSHIAGTLLKTDSTAQATIFSIHAATKRDTLFRAYQFGVRFHGGDAYCSKGFKTFSRDLLFVFVSQVFFGRYPPFSWLIVFNVIFLRARER